jgi:hypothetical protein
MPYVLFPIQKTRKRNRSKRIFWNNFRRKQLETWQKEYKEILMLHVLIVDYVEMHALHIETLKMK